LTLRLVPALLVVATAACVAATQELGGDENAGNTRKPAPGRDLGGGLAPGVPDPDFARELACPLGSPLPEDACGARKSAPCAYPDFELSDPDRPPPSPPDPATQTVCLCSSELRWSCRSFLQFRDLSAPVRPGDPCRDGVEVTQPCEGPECAAFCGARRSCDLTCACERGRFTCRT
jgi:hypothetical protein